MDGEDPEEAALYAALGPAKYLQAMMAKGKAEAAAKKAGMSARCPTLMIASAPALDVTPASPVEAFRPSQDGPSARPAASSATIAGRPSPATPQRVEPRPTTRAAVLSPSTPAPRSYPPAPMVPPDEVSAVVARMTRGLAEALRAEDVGRRRVGPKKLAAQLAEVRRRRGRSGGMEV